MRPYFYQISYPERGQAAHLSDELSQARQCLADFSSRVSVSQHGSLDPAANTTGTPYTTASAAQAAQAAAAATASAWNWRGANMNPASASGLAASSRFSSSILEDSRAGDGTGGGGGGGGNPELEGEGMDGALGSRLFSDIMESNSLEMTTPARHAGVMRESPPGWHGGGMEEEKGGLRSPRAGMAAGHKSSAGPLDRDVGGGGHGGVAEHQAEDDSGVFDLENLRGFVREESQRLRESVRGGRSAEL